MDVVEVSERAGGSDGEQLLDDLSKPAGGTGLRSWAEVLWRVLSSAAETDSESVHQVVELVDEAGESGTGPSPYRAAATLSRNVFEDRAGDPNRHLMAALAGFYLLKTKGLEPGRSPVDDRRINRLLNTGSQALDWMIEQPGVRRGTLEALFWRLMERAVGRGRIDASGLGAELSFEVVVGKGGDKETGRRRTPPDDDLRRAPGGAVIDWILEELVARGLTSVTLGSVVEEKNGRRDHVIDDAFGDWIGGLPDDEGQFVAGALFAPAVLGGELDADERRVLDAAAVAHQICSDAGFDEQKSGVYRKRLRQIDELRRIPASLSPTYEVRADGAVWRGRWQAAVHPLRRVAGQSEGIFCVEAGFFFGSEGPDVATWSDEQRRAFRHRLQEIAEREDDRKFTAFGDRLNGVVERLNRRPGQLLGDDTLLEPSPLWEPLARGVVEVRRALESGDGAALEQAFERWTVRCA